MAFWVYILRCADGSYYTGHTDTLDKRIHEHHAGAIASCYTFKRRPLQLAFSQDFPTREEALASEQQIKGWSRKKKEAMLRGDWAEVSRLAQSKSVRPEPVEGPRSPAAACPEPVVRPFDRLPAHHDRETTTVRAELVEARPERAEQSSVHPSTSSGRTDGESSL